MGNICAAEGQETKINTTPVERPIPVTQSAQHSAPKLDYDWLYARTKSLVDCLIASGGVNLDEQNPELLESVEHAVLASVLENLRGNQTKSSEVLALNRGTLRKRLNKYGLI